MYEYLIILAMIESMSLGIGSNLLRKLRITDEIEEEERLQLGNGSCFGEWSSIYNKRRSASAFVLEDTDLFFLDNDIFQEHLLKYIIKAEFERKCFIKSKIKVLDEIRGFEEYYKRVVPIVLY